MAMVSGEGASTAEPQQNLVALEQRLRSGAHWFYWIAGLSVLNSGIQLFGSDRSFIVGLGITQVFDAVATGATQETEGTVRAVVKAMALGLDLLVAGFFVLLGWQAGKRRAWAFVLGMVMYALDALIFVLIGDWVSVGFHAFALFGVWTGYAGLKALRAAEIRFGSRAIEPGAA